MLNAKNFALTGGILWGLWIFAFTFLHMYRGYAPAFGLLMMQLYPGYHLTLSGAFIGLIYGFLDGFISLFIFAWIYNKLNKLHG